MMLLEVTQYLNLSFSFQVHLNVQLNMYRAFRLFNVDLVWRELKPDWTNRLHIMLPSFNWILCILIVEERFLKIKTRLNKYFLKFWFWFLQESNGLAKFQKIRIRSEISNVTWEKNWIPFISNTERRTKRVQQS